MRDGAGSRGDFVAGNFAHANEIAIRRRNKEFVGGEKIFGVKSLLDNGDSRFRRNFEKNSARDTFETAGIQRRGQNLSVLYGENICGRAFGNFPALIEKDNFVKTFFLRFGDGPNILQPRCCFDSCERRSSVTSLFAKSQPYRLVVLRKRR